MQSVYLKIGGVTMSVFTDDPSLALGVGGATSKFRIDPTVPDLTLAVAWRDHLNASNGARLFTSGPLWQLHQESEGYRFTISASNFGNEPYKMACLSSDFTSGEIDLHRRYYDGLERIDPLEYPLDELLILNLLARGRGLLVHGCGLIDSSGEGYLFVGQSGAGKTTMARLWQRSGGVEILSDDRIIVRRSGDGFLMCGTPWHGEADLASAAEAPLKKIFFLRQGSKNELVHLKKAESAVRLFASSFPPFYSSDALDFILQLQDEISRSLFCSELRFVPDESVIDFVRGQL
jgi:hypothetical protein